MAKYTRRDLEDMVETDGADSFYKEFVHGVPGYLVCYGRDLTNNARRAFPYSQTKYVRFVFADKDYQYLAVEAVDIDKSDQYNMGSYVVYAENAP